MPDQGRRICTMALFFFGFFLRKIQKKLCFGKLKKQNVLSKNARSGPKDLYNGDVFFLRFFGEKYKKNDVLGNAKW